MSCSEWVEQISRMTEGSLAGDDLMRLERHLAVCPLCRAELALQRRIVRALSVPPASELAPDFSQRVAARALAEEKRTRRARLWLPLVPPLAAAATAATLFALGMDLAAQSPSMFEQTAGALLKPLAWAAQVVFGLIGGAAELQRKLTPALGWISGPAAGIALAVAVGVGPVLWGLRRVLAYLR